MKIKSQNDLILRHLQKHGSISSWEAIQTYGITRLSARIFDLKDLGHGILTIMEYKNGTKFAKYILTF
jgi:hypothetical protein